MSFERAVGKRLDVQIDDGANDGLAICAKTSG